MRAPLPALLEEGVAAGIFPAAWAEVRWHGERVFAGGAGGAGSETLWDLASLTKVIASTAAFLALWGEGLVEPSRPVSDVFPESAAGRAAVSVGDLLAHRAGLPAFVPFFAPVLRQWPALLDPGDLASTRARAREAVVEAALRTPLEAPPRTRATYGDVAFIILGELLAAVAGTPLDRLYDERVAPALGLGARFRRLSTRGLTGASVPVPAPTGVSRPREPAPGQEGLWVSLPTRPSRPGEVDDDNAWAMDGVAGHAGLFGTGADVAAFGQGVLEELGGARRLAPPGLWAQALARDAETPGSTRALGFDTVRPGDDPAQTSAGSLIGQSPPGAVGHLGFTGASLWVDLGRSLVIALCTNRVALGRGETRIRAFRPRFHDAVVEALGRAG